MVTDRLPAGAVFVSAGPGGYTFDGGNNTLTWNLTGESLERNARIFYVTVRYENPAWSGRPSPTPRR